MPTYCICRTNKGDGFMIGCDNCEEWFHGKCIEINRKAAKNIDKYYCDACLKRNPSLKILYKNLPVPKPQPEKKTLEERKQEKPKSNTQNRRKTNNQKKKSKDPARKQCLNLDCIYEARADSKYCSSDCGLEFNKLRYEKHFIPKWRDLSDKGHSQGRLKRLTDLDRLGQDKNAVVQLIKNLRLEKEEVEQNIKIIKEHARKQYIEKKENENSKENDDEDVEMDNDEVETTSGDASKTFCITCGGPILADNTFRHWSSCHKKHEDLYNFTADVVFKHSHCDSDPDPKLYCHQQDKKSKRFCMNLESACPQHTNWLSDKDEVCGCPLKIRQKLVVDGNYCLELKKNCNLHYHWDKFRLAQINVQRVQAFTRLDTFIDQMMKTRKIVEDTYGGVVGLMLHNTLDFNAI